MAIPSDRPSPRRRDLTDFKGGNPEPHHLFCRRCGVHAFEQIEAPKMTGAPCVDGLDIDTLLAGAER